MAGRTIGEEFARELSMQAAVRGPATRRFGCARTGRVLCRADRIDCGHHVERQQHAAILPRDSFVCSQDCVKYAAVLQVPTQSALLLGGESETFLK